MITEPWINTEQTLIGGLLIDPKAYWRIAGKVMAEHFGNRGHSEVFAAIAERMNSGMPVDAVTLGDQFTSIRVYLTEIANETIGTGNIEAYADIVRDHAELRAVNQAGQQISKLQMDELDSAQSILNAALKPKSQSVKSLEEILPEFHSELQARFDAGGHITGLSTGLKTLDEMTGGLQNGDLFYIAARPSMGKTALLIQLMDHIAINHGPVLVFSMEMPAVQVVGRMISMHARISGLALRSPSTMTELEWPRYTASAHRVRSIPMHIDERAALSIEQVQSTARMYKQKYGIVAIGLDYVQLMRFMNPRDQNASVSAISSGLKQMAKDLNLPVIALSQLNRDNEKATDKRPNLSGLRASGSLEQDADLVGLLHRQDYYEKESRLAGFAELNIAKQRNGPVGVIPLRTELQYSRFLHADSLPAESISEAPRTPRSTSFVRTQRNYSDL